MWAMVATVQALPILNNIALEILSAALLAASLSASSNNNTTNSIVSSITNSTTAVSSKTSRNITSTTATATASTEPDDIDEPDYSYKDIYSCSGISISTPEDLSKAKYGCRYEGLAAYYIKVGNQATKNLTWFINHNDSFTSNYNAYTKAIQLSILSEFGEWIHTDKNQDYYECHGKSNLYKCLLSTVLNPGRSLCGSTVTKMQNMNIAAKNMDKAAASLASFYNITMNSSDLLPVTSKQKIPYSDKHATCTFTIKNVTAPKAASIIPNPMAGLTKENVTDVQSLIEKAEKQLGKVSAYDLVDTLTPIPIFTTVSENVLEINTQGKKVKKVEKEERKLMILNIVLGLVGVFTMFLGPIESILTNVVLDAINIFSQWAVTGHLDAENVGLILMSSVVEIFGAMKLGKGVSETASIFRYSKKAGFTKKMFQFKDYKKPMELMFGITFSTAQLLSS